MQYEYMGQDMDAVTGDAAVSSNITDDCAIYHEIPGGGVYDPGFAVGTPPAAPEVAEDPRVQMALDRLDQALSQGPGSINGRDFFGIPWPWIAGGLLITLLVRR